MAKVKAEVEETEEEETYLEYSIDGGIHIHNESTGTINVTVIQSGSATPPPNPPKP